MVKTLLIYAFLGFLAFMIFDILDFYKKTKPLTWAQTFKLYFRIDVVLKMFLGALVLVVVVNISLMEGGTWVVSTLTSGSLDGGTPAQLCFFAFLIGVFNQWLWDKLINFINPSNHQIQLPPGSDSNVQ